MGGRMMFKICYGTQKDTQISWMVQAVLLPLHLRPHLGLVEMLRPCRVAAAVSNTEPVCTGRPGLLQRSFRARNPCALDR